MRWIYDFSSKCHKTIFERKGLFHITFDVKEGEVFGYLGPNGAGKSTTIRNLMGFIKPTSGKSSILDWIVGRKQRKFKGKLVICG